RYADSTKAKKGTAEVDKAFLAEIELWRDALARNLALRNPGLSQRELNYAVQATIDRIIFLRICEDRGIEPYGRLQGLCNGGGTYGRLRQLFFEADQRYNSGLFHFAEEKGRSGYADRLTPALAIDDKPLKDVLRRLYYPESPYEFSVLPADILGQVYEQFLGKVIRLTAGHQAKVEDKPEVKKAGGVYYTPTYIVDYIVKNTVGRLLEGKAPKEAASLRILDPACGSGSFLIGAYQYLLDWHRDWYAADAAAHGAKKHAKALYQGPGGEWRLTSAEKKRILLNSIYGVDIDAQAVETTKLSLLLKVLEGESSESLDAQLSFLRERALPDLSANIKCGNSLIGPSFYDDEQLGLAGLDEEERYRINVFDWEAEFPEVLGKAVPEERRGFDAVIGNPPYIRVQRIGHSEADYCFANYGTLTSKTDLSQVFLEKSLQLVSAHGRVGFICTSQWLQTDYGRKMRELLSNGTLHEIVHFGSLKVFQGADTYPAIFVLGRQPVTSISLRRIDGSLPSTVAAIEAVPATTLALAGLGSQAWNLGELHIPAALNRGSIAWRPLSQYGRVLIGALTGMDSVFVLSPDRAERLGLEAELLLPYAYRGAEVHRFEWCEPGAQVLYPYRRADDGRPALIPESELSRACPEIHAYLCSHKDELRSRMDSRKLYATGEDWYRHLRAGSFQYIDPPKLIVKGIATRSTVGLLREDTVFNGANCPGIVLGPEALPFRDFFLGVLNSSVASFHLRSVCPPKLGGYSRLNARSIAATPIPDVDALREHGLASRFESISALAAELTRLHGLAASARQPAERERAERDTAACERRLNVMVHELYGLSDDEVALIEAT
ncbi:MAG: N-6 DNA methylase, partial [Thermoleophilia bacterium]